jgi:hypothetical protein
MDIGILDNLFDLGKTAIEKIWPDPVKAAEELRKLEALRQSGNLAEMQMTVNLMLAQINVNLQEAKHKSIFVAGWRPWIGWVGGFSLAYAGIIHPILLWVWAMLQAVDVIPKDMQPPPFVESGTLGSIVTGMLGIGAMRSHDKKHGVQDR